MAEAQRQQFFRNLLMALGPLSDEEERTQGTFATCEVIKPSQGFVMRSIQVEGAGVLQLPLSVADASKLRRVCEQAPFGRGSATLVDTSVRRCWQVDASKLCFPGSPSFLSDAILPLAMLAVRALGIDGARIQLEAHLYKLLFYEAGGHFSLHRDTEKERGMFATFILQLPTAEGYTGGEVVVRHLNEVKTFDCQMVSSLGFCHTAFFADCLHELREIKSGTRLCLAFNLVRRDSSSEPILRGLISRKLTKTQAELEPWLKAAKKGELNFVGGKLAFPLEHKYTEVNLSFAGLKGDDSILAEVLKNVRDENKQKWLDLHLCLVTKYVTGNASEDRCMEDIIDEETVFKNWIGEDDQPTSVPWIKELTVDFDKEIVVEEPDDECPFHSDPDESEYEGDMGNYGNTVEYWYHRALLVVWPTALSTSVLCDIDISHALESLQISDPNFRGRLHQIVIYCHENVWNVWPERSSNPKQDSVTPMLLSMCTRARMSADVVQILRLLGKPFVANGRTTMIGVRNLEVAKAIAKAILVVGWKLVSGCVIHLVKNQRFDSRRVIWRACKTVDIKGQQGSWRHCCQNSFCNV